MQKTIVYGGSFNPPTIAHAAIIEACVEYDPAADIWVMPSGSRVDKELPIAIEHRIAMVRTMINATAITQCELNDSELRAAKPTQTFDTVRRLAQEHPDRNFTFVFGADSYASMSQWAGGIALQKSLLMLLIPRVGYEIIDPTHNVTVLPFNMPHSSSAVRERFNAGNAIDDLVCSGVAHYIRQHGLYTPAYN